MWSPSLLRNIEDSLGANIPTSVSNMTYLGSWFFARPCSVVQIVDREQELMSTAGLQSLGGGAGLGRGSLDRELRIVPSKQTLCWPLR